MRWVYSALFYLAAPFLLLRLWRKGRANPAYRQRWRERFALQTIQPPPQGVIWLHAVSVGETEALAPLLKHLQQRHPDIPLLVTSTTPTGSARVAALFGDTVRHQYLPYDLPWAVNRFLDSYRPRLAVFMETEIWPNWFAGCAARNIPLAIANARLSERSCRGYRRLSSWIKQILAAAQAVAAQTEADAQRFASLGVPAERLHVLGNLKFDRAAPPDFKEQGQALRQALWGQRPCWIAASTHAGEEEQVLDAHQSLRQAFPDLLLILAPRHPERCEAIAQLLQSQSHAYIRRSSGQPCPAEVSVFLLDTLGELGRFYAATDVAFVGGSLVAIGGHNVLEPAVLGIPVLFGPQVFHFADITRRLQSAHGARQIQDAAELAWQVEHLLHNDADRQQLGQAGQAFVAANRGAVERHADLLESLLVPRRVG